MTRALRVVYVPFGCRGQGSGLPFDVDEVGAELRRQGFDLRRSVFVSYLVGCGADRDTALALRRQGAADGWQASVYADRFAWVVRLSRVGLARMPQLARDYQYVLSWAQQHDAGVRGVVVEELRGDDVWDVLAAKLVAEVAPAAAARDGHVRQRGGARRATRVA